MDRTAARRANGTLPLLAVALAGSLLAAGFACAPEPQEAGAEGGLVVLPDPTAVQDPDLLPRPYYHDFGTVPDGEVVQHAFRVRNVEAHPITIERISASCGCTVPSVSYVDERGERVVGASPRAGAEDLITIPPGVVAELELRIDTRDIRTKNDDKLYTVTVATDAPDHRFFKVEAHIKVESPFLLTPNGIDLKTIPRSAGGTGHCDVVQAPGYAHRVEGLRDVPDDVEASLRHEERFGRNVWVLEASLRPPLALGRQTRYFQIATVDAEGRPYRPIEVGLTAFVTEDVLAEPPRLIAIAERGASEPVTTTAEVRSQLAGQRITITDVILEGPRLDGLDVTYEPEALDAEGRSASWTVTLSARPPAGEDVLQGKVFVTLAGGLPPVEIPFVVHVR